MEKHIVLSWFLVPVALLATTVYASNGWNIQTVDNSGDTGHYSSLAYDSQGYPHIVYYNSSSRSLMYTRWTGGGWHSETIHAMPSPIYDERVGEFCSIAIDDEDNPHVAYYLLDWYFWGPGYHNAGALWYAYKDNAGWHISGIHGLGDLTYCGSYTSIAVARDPNLGIVVPHIAYYAQTGGDLWHAWQDTGGWHTAVVDGAGDVGQYTSIALDDQQHIYISYYDAGAQDLKFAYYDGSQWGSQIIDGADAVGKFTSLVLDALGTVHITYYDETNGNLKHASLNLQ